MRTKPDGTMYEDGYITVDGVRVGSFKVTRCELESGDFDIVMQFPREGIAEKIIHRLATKPLDVSFGSGDPFPCWCTTLQGNQNGSLLMSLSDIEEGHRLSFGKLLTSLKG